MSTNTKLTLSLDSAAIQAAKLYAQVQGTSLSSMVEDFFKGLVYKGNKTQYSPLVEELAGIVDLSDSDTKSEYADYLEKKYE